MGSKILKFWCQKLCRNQPPTRISRRAQVHTNTFQFVLRIVYSLVPHNKWTKLGRTNSYLWNFEPYNVVRTLLRPYSFLFILFPCAHSMAGGEDNHEWTRIMAAVGIQNINPESVTLRWADWSSLRNRKQTRACSSLLNFWYSTQHHIITTNTSEFYIHTFPQ